MPDEPKKLQIADQNLPEDNPKTRQPDIALAREILLWEPAVSLEQRLEQSLLYFRDLLT